MTTLLAFAFVLGVLVFVHELGHFMMARWHGVRVLMFSLGFGPKLLKVKRGDTEYAISAIPLGGYVKMAGENPEDQRTGSSDEFLSKTKWQRFQILIMGPLMNLGLAVVLMAIVLMQGAASPVVSGQAGRRRQGRSGLGRRARGPAAGRSIICAWQTTSVPTWDRFLHGHRHQGRSRCAAARRSATAREQRIMVRPAGQGRFEVGDIGVLPDVYPSVAGVVPGSPAEQAGLNAGDVILAINDERVVFSQDVVEIISKNVECQRSRCACGATAPSRPSPSRPRQEGDLRAHRHRHRQRDDDVSARAARGDRSQRPAQHRVLRADPQDALGTHRRRDLAEAADGSRRHRAALRRIGAGGLDRALRA